jgi:hypothetical protein
MHSTNDIEREVENQRASVESTLDALKERMSFDKLANDLAPEEVRDAIGVASARLRENPIAVGLIGLGLAWLVFGGKGSDDDWDDEDYDRDGVYGDPRVRRSYPGAAAYDPYQASSSQGAEAEGVLDKAGKVAHDAAERVGQTAHDVRDRVGQVAHDIGDRLSGVASAVGDKLSGAGEAVAGVAGKGKRRLSRAGEGIASHTPDGRQIRQASRRARNGVADAIENQPLLAGAAVAILGAAIAAALPSTRTERRAFAEPRETLLREGRRVARDLRDQAEEAAKAGLDAARSKAEEEGLSLRDQDGRSLAERAEAVAKAGLEAARDATEQAVEARSQEAGSDQAKDATKSGKKSDTLKPEHAGAI